jgi:LPS sulfotransferase NodH
MTLMVLQQTTLENTSKVGIAIVVHIHRNDALSQSASFWRFDTERMQPLLRQHHNGIEDLKWHHSQRGRTAAETNYLSPRFLSY